MAAVLIAFISIGTLYLVSPLKKSNGDKIFSSYYVAFNAPDEYRSNTGMNNELVRVSFMNYSKGNYKEAQTGFEKLLLEVPENTSYRFYLGISLIENSQFEDATIQFKKVIELNDPIFQQPSEWYSCLCLLKQKKESEAIPLLKQLVSDNCQYSKPASEILLKLGK